MGIFNRLFKKKDSLPDKERSQEGIELDTWHPRSASQEIGLSGVAFGNDIFVAVGSRGTILSSSDGVTWVSRNSGTTSDLRRITYGNGRFVAVGASYTITTSSDGISWQARSVGASGLLLDVAYGNHAFVVLGRGGKILTCADAANWVIAYKNPFPTWLYGGVAYGKEGFVVATGSGEIMTSPDGKRWTERNSGNPSMLFGVAYGKDLFIALTETPAILTSPDGITWRTSISGTSDQLRGAVYGAGTFVCVGDSGTILSSCDANIWVSRNSGTLLELSAVTYGKGTFVAVGIEGTILQTGRAVEAGQRTEELPKRDRQLEPSSVPAVDNIPSIMVEDAGQLASLFMAYADGLIKDIQNQTPISEFMHRNMVLNPELSASFVAHYLACRRKYGDAFVEHVKQLYIPGWTRCIGRKKKGQMATLGDAADYFATYFLLHKLVATAECPEISDTYRYASEA